MNHIISEDNFSKMDVIVEKFQFCIRCQLKDANGDIKERNHILLGKRDGLKVYELLGQFIRGEL